MTTRIDDKGPVRSKGRGKSALGVYTKLREDILRMELAPGALLDEVEIGKQFNLSRSPVREALIRLSAEGLVKTLPNKSTLVAPLNMAEFPRFIDALDLMQRVTTRLAAKLRTEEDIKNIRAQQTRFEKALEKRDVLAMIETNKDFHVAISVAGKNVYFTQYCERLLDEGRRMLRMYFRFFDDTLPPELAVEHLDIIQAIADGDEDRAEKLAHLHTLQVSASILASLGARHTSDIDVIAPNDSN